jgi:hypothetical protein
VENPVHVRIAELLLAEIDAPVARQQLTKSKLSVAKSLRYRADKYP